MDDCNRLIVSINELFDLKSEINDLLIKRNRKVEEDKNLLKDDSSNLKVENDSLKFENDNLKVENDKYKKAVADSRDLLDKLSQDYIKLKSLIWYNLVIINLVVVVYTYNSMCK